MGKTFWDRTAKVYDRFMQGDHRAYKRMYAEIYPVVRHKNVLELATGTGLKGMFSGFLLLSQRDSNRQRY